MYQWYDNKVLQRFKENLEEEIDEYRIAISMGKQQFWVKKRKYENSQNIKIMVTQNKI